MYYRLSTINNGARTIPAVRTVAEFLLSTRKRDSPLAVKPRSEKSPNWFSRLTKNSVSACPPTA